MDDYIFGNIFSDNILSSPYPGWLVIHWICVFLFFHSFCQKQIKKNSPDVVSEEFPVFYICIYFTLPDTIVHQHTTTHCVGGLVVTVIQVCVFHVFDVLSAKKMQNSCWQ